jgi:molybdate transport system substrate-binding protein
MDGVVAAGLVEAASVVPSFGNALVVIAPTASAQGPLPGADAISGALGDGRLALAEPSAVPAGIYARQALERLGVWAALLPKLVPAKDVRSALVFVERGEAPLGIVYGTDAAASSLVRVVWQVPDGLHDPVIYPLALTRLGAAQPAAGAFFAYLKSDAGRRHFADRGFALR